VIARRLHALSARAVQPLIKVNMGGIAESVFESEMFGHVRGAFTDAKADRIGRFELADGGSLFLDEIANIPPSQQPKLLRVLEDGELERVGSSRTLKVDVRLVSATNADLRAEVAGRALPQGPAVPPQHGRDPPAAAARARRGHRADGRGFPRPLRRALRPRRPAAGAFGAPRAAELTPGRATCASCRTSSSARC
jgi:hypothetical protein